MLSEPRCNQRTAGAPSSDEASALTAFSKNSPIFFVDDNESTLKKICHEHVPDALVMVGSRDYSLRELQSDCSNLQYLVLSDERQMEQTSDCIRKRPERFVEVARGLASDTLQWSIFRIAASNIASVV